MPIVFIPHNGGYAEVETLEVKPGDEVIVIDGMAIRPREVRVGDSVITINVEGQSLAIPINQIVPVLPVGSTVLKIK